MGAHAVSARLDGGRLSTKKVRSFLGFIDIPAYMLRKAGSMRYRVYACNSNVELSVCTLYVLCVRKYFNVYVHIETDVGEKNCSVMQSNQKDPSVRIMRNEIP